MKIQALVSFAGKVTMAVNEVREVPDEIAKDLIQAKYAKKTNAKAGDSDENQ